ncbi:2-C-methyl-D-erythritol 4-phosphate cytidylyltransferase [Frankliniella fusca]|uniref:2-C-methyl-D-erythritol 4-phosphate cytidylyltransferase n=1 Tax=Frankliniella fusca TaxID=407009 RepID=A0AAE1L9C7_9NEOP|nr:2-C-methyl-D-erythritol 4-phosphate cytidylyltransferase [Frankliniella fusca]
MESRSELAYRDLFNFIRRIVPELDPDFIMSDFETAQLNAFVEDFPRARLSGCLWHYARAVCRNVRSLGLHAFLRDSEIARRIVRHCLAVPLAPPGWLLEALNAVITEACRLDLQDQFRAEMCNGWAGSTRWLSKLCYLGARPDPDLFNYLRVTWIEGVGERVLCVFGVRHRTNNVAEAHHRNLNSRVVRRPNVWRFIG